MTVHFIPHIDFPDIFLGSVNDNTKKNYGQDKNIYKQFCNPAGTEEDYQAVKRDEPDSDFGRPRAEIGNLELAGCAERQKRACHKTSENRNQ
jgi:hypothetical protein